MSILELMGAPFAECLVLVAIHTYLGIHVLKRRVIFVDLALAQIAALGTTVGFLFGIMPDTSAALLFSMAFTFLGAGVFAVTRFRHERVPQEAIIGLTYAISAAIAVLVVEKTRGAEHLKDILVGNLLWVQWSEVGMAAAIYLVIGVLHVVFRRRFLAISDNPERAFQAGIAVRAWDFLFYITFGIVITVSTRVAGVLLVFVFLVAPAILALLVTTRLAYQLLIGWGTGTVVTVLGLYLSWVLDLPSGPAVITFYGVALSLGAMALFMVRAQSRSRAARSLLLGVTVIALAAGGVWLGGRWLGTTDWAVSREARRVEHDLERDHAAFEARRVERHQARRDALSARTARCVGPNKHDRYLGWTGPEERLQHARTAIAENERRGLEFLLLCLADDETPLLYREEAVALLRETTGRDFGYQAEGDVSDNATPIARICDHLRVLKRRSE